MNPVSTLASPPPPRLSLSLRTQVARRVGGIRTVSSGAVNREVPQAEFLRRCREFQAEAAQNAGDMAAVVRGLWRAEGLATTVGKHLREENSLADPALPRELLGITHVGFGAAATEHVHFDAARLRGLFAGHCLAGYEPFAIEGVGSILRIYEGRLFRRFCGWLGLIPRNAPPGPDRRGFFQEFLARFTDEEQRLITHGYGRLVAFSQLGLDRALAFAHRLPPPRVAPCVQGIAFACAMMNAADMGRLLASSGGLAVPPDSRAAFQNGLVYGLVFCEWFVPGFLGAWSPGVDEARPPGITADLIALARSEARKNAARGRLPAFRLENPL